METELRKLIELNDRLTALFADPQPGLETWMLAVARTVESMADIVGRPQ